MKISYLMALIIFFLPQVSHTMSVHYKFKSAMEYSTLPVDGMNISVEDLKEAIFEQKKLSRALFDLIVTNAETMEGECIFNINCNGYSFFFSIVFNLDLLYMD